MTTPVRYERTKAGGRYYWRLTWYDRAGNRQRRGGGCCDDVTVRKIRQKAFDLAAQLGEGCVPIGSSGTPTLSQWLEVYQEQRTDLGERTKMLHEATGAYLLQCMGDVRLDKITRADAAAWRSWLVRDRLLGEQTVCAHCRNAKVIFRHAVDQELMPANPFDRLRGTPPAMELEFRSLTDTEVWQLLESIQDPDWKRLMGLCALAGLRRGEALRLRWRDVGVNKLRVVAGGAVTTKARGRDVRLEPALATLLGCPGEPDAPVCRLPAATDWHRKALDLIVAAGLAPWPKPYHTLRKNRATSWRELYPEHVVDAWMGHSLAVARRHYAAVPESAYQ